MVWTVLLEMEQATAGIDFLSLFLLNYYYVVQSPSTPKW